MSGIHATAVVDPRAELDASVSVGPYAVIGPHVRVGAGTTIGAHCVIEGHTRIGSDNRIFQFASIGAAPQDKKYAGEPTRLEIGHGNTIREFVTINTGTVQDEGVTRLGDDNWIMAYVHIAHDCQLGSHIILANAVQLAGHVHLGDWVFLGGLTGVHQFVRIGRMSILGGYTKVVKDVPPYMLADGDPLKVYGPNKVGLERHGVSPEAQQALKEAYKIVFRTELTTAKALDRIEAELAPLPEIRNFVEFIRKSERGISK